jgi:hypothetical protein
MLCGVGVGVYVTDGASVTASIALRFVACGRSNRL